MTDWLTARLRPYRGTIFGEMSALAAATDSVNLGQGFPDTDGPPEIVAAAVRALTTGLGNQYPPAHGVPELRREIAEHQKRWYDIPIDPDTEVVVSTGASEALAAVMLALLEPGDEVLAFEPYFDIYAPQVSMAGGRLVTVALAPEFRPDTQALAAACSPRTKLILINSPHNPTGAVYTPTELDAIGRVAIEHDLLIVSDEAHEHIWFADHAHVPTGTRPGLADRTITIGSAGKTFSFTGWKVGWATGPADLIEAVRVARQHLSYVSGGPFQYAIAEALRLPDSYFDGLRKDLQERRDIWCTGLQDLGIDVSSPEGTYFAISDVQALGYSSGLDFCLDLPGRAGVVAIPLAGFASHPGCETLVRWAFCKRPEVLRQALSGLQRAFT